MSLCCTFTLTLLSRNSFLILSILPVLHSGNAYANSEGYATPVESYRSRTHSRALFLFSVNTRSPLEAPVMSTKGH